MINPFILETHKERLVNDAFINFKFDEKEHIYSSKENPKYISITRLLREMQITPSYDSVDEETLKRAADYGNTIHSDIENYCKLGDSFTAEADKFIGWGKANNINVVASEYRVHDDKLAGSIDLIYRQNNELVISDIKTTSQVHKEAVSWQLSLYRYLLKEDIKKATCIHIRPDVFEVIDIPLKSNEECENLLKCYFNNESYNVAVLEEQQIQVLMDLQDTINNLKQQQKEAENKLQTIKDALMNAMDNKGLISVEIELDNKKVKITKVSPKDKETIDYKQLIIDNPNLDIEPYKSYSPVKPYIKISG